MTLDNQSSNKIETLKSGQPDVVNMSLSFKIINSMQETKRIHLCQNNSNENFFIMNDSLMLRCRSGIPMMSSAPSNL